MGATRQCALRVTIPLEFLSYSYFAFRRPIIGRDVALAAWPHSIGIDVPPLFNSLTETTGARGVHRDDFYTSLCNYLDYTASVFPVTTVDKRVDTPVPAHEFRNHEDEAVYKMCEYLPSLLPFSFNFPPFRPQPWLYNTLRPAPVPPVRSKK